jgi:hypothetical protein
MAGVRGRVLCTQASQIRRTVLTAPVQRVDVVFTPCVLRAGCALALDWRLLAQVLGGALGSRGQHEIEDEPDAPRLYAASSEGDGRWRDLVVRRATA